MTTSAHSAESQEDVASVGRAQVERDAALPAVAADEVRAPRVAGLHGQPARLVAAPGQLDLDHVGTPLAQRRRGLRSLHQQAGFTTFSPSSAPIGSGGRTGPLPIWSRTVTTGGLVSERRCQLAPSTTSVWPGDEAGVRRREERRRPAELLALADAQRGLARVLVVGAVEVAAGCRRSCPRAGTGPGTSPFTWMPYGPHSTASDSVRFFTPALAAAECTKPGTARPRVRRADVDDRARRARARGGGGRTRGSRGTCR